MIMRFLKSVPIGRTFIPVLLLWIVAASGCTNPDAPEHPARLPGVPQEAELAYTYASDGTYGVLVTTDVWNHTEDTGFFVLEVLHSGGSIRQMELRGAAGETVASLGDVEEDKVFITDLVTEAGGDYLLYFEESDYFDGEIRVYFISGIGYSLAE